MPGNTRKTARNATKLARNILTPFAYPRWMVKTDAIHTSSSLRPSGLRDSVRDTVKGLPASFLFSHSGVGVGARAGWGASPSRLAFPNQIRALQPDLLSTTSSIQRRLGPDASSRTETAMLCDSVGIRRACGDVSAHGFVRKEREVSWFVRELSALERVQRNSRS